MKVLKPTMIIFCFMIGIMSIIGMVQVFAGWQFPQKWDDIGSVMVLGLVTVIMVAFCVITMVSMLSFKFSIKKLGFYAVHLGLILFLIGSGIFMVSGSKNLVSVPINGSYASAIPTQDGSVKLDFSFKLASFKIKYYPPVYAIFEKGNNTPIKTELMADNDGYCDFGKWGKKKVVTSGNVIIENINLDENTVAVAGSKQVEKYTGVINYKKNGKVKNLTIQINKTVRMGKYKVFLMDSLPSQEAVRLLFKVDYGEPFSVIGILLTMLGSVYLVFFEPQVVCKLNGRMAKKKVVSAKGGAKWTR